MFSCHNPDIKWNVMDTVLVMLGILATCLVCQCEDVCETITGANPRCLA